MKEIRILQLAEELNEKGDLYFTHLNRHYDIWESVSEGGYMVEVFELKNGEPIVDGGLCTGNAVDAIKFMLPKEK